MTHTAKPQTTLGEDVGNAGVFAIETKKLSKVFGTRKAVDKVSISVPQGALLPT